MHYRRKLLISAGFFLFLGAAGCFAAGKTSGDGKDLYLAKCAKCHRLYDPAGYGDSDWDYWMKKMKKKSKLSAEQFARITDYIDTLRQSRT